MRPDPGRRPGAGGDVYQVMVHADAAALEGSGASADTEAPAGRLEDGPALAGETVRRLLCDAAVVAMVDGPDGPVATGTKTRTLPPALRRALKARDGGCVFPGCTHRFFLDGHHVRPWRAGGPTTLANTGPLCRAHHRLVHEGGWTMVSLSPGRFAFSRPDGTPMTATASRVPEGDGAIRAANAPAGVFPSPASLEPNWCGERPDYVYLVDGLMAHEQCRDVPAETSLPSG